MSILNFTKRIDIPRDVVDVLVEHSGTDQRELKVMLDLQKVDVPVNAHVLIEAHYRGLHKRFRYGEAGKVQLPHDRRISEFPIDTPAVDITVVDPADHRVLAARRNLRPSLKTKKRRELLSVFTTDLGQTLWRLRKPFEQSGPVLEITDRFPGLETTATFHAFVLPEVFRSILQRILLDPHYDEDDEGAESWQRDWIGFATKFTGDKPPKPDGEDRESWLGVEEEEVHEWIDGAVRAFADNSKNRLLERYQKERGGGG